MKKFVFIILLLILFIPSTVASAANIDWQSMSNQEITDAINEGRLVIASRIPDSEDHVTIANQDGVEIYLTRRYAVEENSYSGNVYLKLEAVVINNRPEPISVGDKGCCVNGWVVDTSGIIEIPAGRMKKGNFEFRITDANITSVADLHDIEFVLEAHHAEEYHNLINFEPFTYVR